MPAQQTFAASRNATWAPPLVYPYQGPQLPLAGGHIAMQLRLYPGAPHVELELNPIASVDALASGTAGGPDEVRTLTLSPSVTPAQLQALPPAGEAGESMVFSFDILITYADSSSEILSSGTYILAPGVTFA